VESGYHNVTIVGHSLGAALALLDSVYLPIFIPNAYYSLVTYGMPRVGNDIFADYVDRNVNVTRITNKYVCLPNFGFSIKSLDCLERTRCLLFPDAAKGSVILKERDTSTSMERGFVVLGKITRIQGVLELKSQISRLATRRTITVHFR
jgi:pimeloyl-ACP methyl ester carboxylesterase